MPSNLLIALHGFGQKPNLWIETSKLRSICNDSNIDVAVPVAPRTFNKFWWGRNWREHDAYEIADIISAQRNNYDKIYVGGFSDGARIALLAGLISTPPVDGVIFHSGVFNDKEKDYGTPEFPLLVIGHPEDKTTILKFGTNPRECYEYYQSVGTDAIWYLHADKNRFGGAHCWGQDSSKFVATWIKAKDQTNGPKPVRELRE